MPARWASGTGIGVRGHEDQAREARRLSLRHDLRHFSPHRVTDQHVAPQVEGTHDALHVIGHVGEGVPAVGGDRAAPVVEEDERRLARAAFRDPKRGARPRRLDLAGRTICGVNPEELLEETMRRRPSCRAAS